LAALTAALPHYMVPDVVVVLDAMPLTANGKVDQQALQARSAGRPVVEVAYVAPETQLERTLAAIWTEVLRVERVGLYDNFFDLGGHSLLMVQVFSRIKAQIEKERAKGGDVSQYASSKVIIKNDISDIGATLGGHSADK